MAITNCSIDNDAFAEREDLNSSCILSSIASWDKSSYHEEFSVQSAFRYLASFSGTTIKVPGTTLAVYLGDFFGLVELGVILGVGIAVLATCGCVCYYARKSKTLSQHSKYVLIWVMACGIVLLPLVVLCTIGPLETVVSNFTMSLFGVLGLFRLIELLYGTGPKGFDSSLGRFVAYVASPAELLFDDEGHIQEASRGLRKHSIVSLMGHTLLMLVVLSLGRSSEFKLLLPQSSEPYNMSYFGFPVALPTLYLQTLLLYGQLTSAMELFRFLWALCGVEVQSPMRQPLFLSTSVRDFWGRRWNLLIHRLMHRSFFQPLAAFIGPRVGAVAAFMVSGLFHEYMWLITNWHVAHYKPGGPLMFFAVQFVLLTAENYLKRTWIGKRMTVLPSMLLTVLTTAAILPFGPLFLHDLQGLRLGALKLYPSFLIEEVPLSVDM